MATRIEINIPLHSSWVPTCMERIIDQKVQGVALSCLEQLIDWIASLLYCPYSNLENAKLARVYTFVDGVTKFYDCTEEGIASLQMRDAVNLVNNQRVQRQNIYINNRRVLFHRNPQVELVFARQDFTNYVVVNNLPNRRIEIIEQELPRQAGDALGAVNRWSFDLGQQTQMGLMANGILPIGEPVPVYLVDQAPRI